MLIDTHAHLDMDPLGSAIVSVLDRAVANGVGRIVTVGIDNDSAVKANVIAEEFEMVFSCLGIHPHNAANIDDADLENMEKLASHKKNVAYGEIGLDFFRDWSPRSDQIRIFQEQIAIAKRLNKPVVIHLRSAYEMGLDMLERNAPFADSGVIHCFSGTYEDAIRAVELGFYLSIPGTITYKKNEQLRSIVSRLPEDRIILETDCPFLAPEPKRGRDNEPSFILYTAQKVADVRGVSLPRLAEITTQNASRVFRFPNL